MEKERDIIKEDAEYRFKMQVTKSMLLDLFLSKELSEKDFKSLMDNLQEWYKQFIKDFAKKKNNQLEIPFNQ